jgi:hypothetical protein
MSNGTPEFLNDSDIFLISDLNLLKTLYVELRSHYIQNKEQLVILDMSLRNLKNQTIDLLREFQIPNLNLNLQMASTMQLSPFQSS